MVRRLHLLLKAHPLHLLMQYQVRNPLLVVWVRIDTYVFCTFLFRFHKKRIICSTLKIIELFGKVCQVEGCGAEYHLTNTIVGCCFTISARCANGHLHKWSSSERITNSTTGDVLGDVLGDVFANNLDFATALVLSGNHFTKIQQFGQF